MMPLIIFVQHSSRNSGLFYFSFKKAFLIFFLMKVMALQFQAVSSTFQALKTPHKNSSVQEFQPPVRTLITK